MSFLIATCPRERMRIESELKIDRSAGMDFASGDGDVLVAINGDCLSV